MITDEGRIGIEAKGKEVRMELWKDRIRVQR